MSPPSLKVSNMLLGKSGGELQYLQEERSGLAKAEMTLSCGCVW